ncbi:hypothetical protein IEQ34_022319 [Dendrobium chrysotoxum]|uniref:non-specific serine/threonine protein kinase n=1 Tax=Dendrobium chrysotoxum TaxID=161865 RepID=A0AAV7FYL8_DENCH|nr:hypothetical protein IEQ34_022319 [Dendrobium chrysotoxum]
MWMFKSFSGKEHAGLEGRVIEIGNTKVRVQNAIAEGGFSCVYLALDAVNASKQYALKHMICQDGESLDLVMKEIQVMKVLKGHPNVVTLVEDSILDIGRRKEALLLMEFCEKSLVDVLESRGATYFEENEVLLIFRDVCNAVFAMHSQSPPIAHRDLKAENVLLGSEGDWRLCDFGSTSTNHKCFDKPEEMGIEEDNIRKHTTPAYRAPEMWDLYKREIICEKVDIWASKITLRLSFVFLFNFPVSCNLYEFRSRNIAALGCLLYRICYFKSAFDGESKLQILNGNYRIPELPKYSAYVTGLIKDMLEGSPDARPDISQARALVWFRVNELLPSELQKHSTNCVQTASTVKMHPSISDVNNKGTFNKTPVIPKRSPPPPPLREKVGKISPQCHVEHRPSPSHGSPMVLGNENALGTFWSSQFAKDSQAVGEKGLLFDEKPMSRTSKQSHAKLGRINSPSEEEQARPTQVSVYKGVEDFQTEDLQIRFSPENKLSFQNKTFSDFVVDSYKPISGNTALSNSINKSRREEELETEMEKLKEQIKQVNLEKTEVTSKFEKLSAICRSQRHEIQELKLTLAIATSSSSKDCPQSLACFSGSPQSVTLSWENIEGTVLEPRRGMLSSNIYPDPKQWQTFADEPKQELMPNTKHSKSSRTNHDHHSSTKQHGSSSTRDDWGFEHVGFSVSSSSSSDTFRSPVLGSSSQRFAATRVKKVDSTQPAGWAGF